VLDGALGGIHAQEVTEPEGLVEGDGERGEQVRQHGLHRERECDATDPEPRQQRLDLHAEIAERQQQRQAPDHDSRPQTGSPPSSS